MFSSQVVVSQPWTLDEALGDALAFEPTWRKPRKPKVFLPRAVRPGEPLEPLNSGRRHVMIVMDSNGFNSVIKLPRRGTNPFLRAKGQIQKIIRQRFISYGCKIRIPEVYFYDHYWHPKDCLGAPRGLLHANNALCMERIPSISSRARSLLVEKLVPENERQAVRSNPLNKKLLARVYLGKSDYVNFPRRIYQNSDTFTLCDVVLSLKDMDDMGLDLDKIAGEMGSALAIVHWSAMLDGRGIEFVLGSTERGQNAIWCHDFDRCTFISLDVDGVYKAFRAFQLNAPFLPRRTVPGTRAQTNMDIFVYHYQRTSNMILWNQKADIQSLPSKFIQLVETGKLATSSD